jgi:hypothetical protein
MTTTAKKLNEIMQCGLQFRILNKPVQDDYLWDIKIFWEHVGITISEEFDDIEECVDDCLDYVRNYKDPENGFGFKK